MRSYLILMIGVGAVTFVVSMGIIGYESLRTDYPKVSCMSLIGAFIVTLPIIAWTISGMAHRFNRYFNTVNKR